MLWLIALAAQAVPLQLTHTGRLIDQTSGLPLDGSHTINVTLYNAATGGSVLWSEDVAAQVTEGYFAIELGTDTVNNALDASVLGGDNVWVGIAVDGGAELPDRHHVVSVPYAVLAGTATHVDGGVVNASEVQIDGVTMLDGSGIVGGATLSGLTCIAGQVPIYDGTAWGCAAQGTSVDWTAITGIPVDFADDVDNDSLASLTCGFDEVAKFTGTWGCAPDAVLTEADVETFIENGPVDLAAGSTLGGAPVFAGSVAWADLTGIPADLADGVVDWSEVGSLPGIFADGVLDWSEVGSMPADFADGVDDVLDEAAVEAFIENGDIALAGVVSLGTTADACPSTAAPGTLRYEADTLEVCTGAGWVTVAGGKDGSSAPQAGDTCDQIHTDFPSLPDGTYWIDPTGAGPFRVYCDMTTDGGGWTRIARFTPYPQPTFNTVNYLNGQIGTATFPADPENGDWFVTFPHENVPHTEAMARSTLNNEWATFDASSNGWISSFTNQGGTYPSNEYQPANRTSWGATQVWFWWCSGNGCNENLTRTTGNCGDVAIPIDSACAGHTSETTMLYIR